MNRKSFKVPFNSACGMIAFFPIIICFAFLAPQPVTADVPFNTTPDWISSDHEVSTGAALADLDQDGWPDLVVANGNDIYRQRLVVYYNQGDGSFPNNPDWQSNDIDYHGHLAVGDVNGDGYPDVAVSVYIGPAGFSEPGRVKLYVNDGTGTLGTTPAWTTGYDIYTFRCAWGDVDLDGDLDLAVACGESYTNRPLANRIFRNTGGTLESTPVWTSTEVDSSYDVSFADVDLDGDLDLAFCNNGEPNRVYFNNAGTLSASAGWSSTDASRQANTLAWGDVNRDGYSDLAVADNNQEGGSGRFKIYLNNGSGQLGTTPFWTSNESGYGSSVVFSDVDDDGRLDLISGQWWGPVRVYLNNGSGYPSSASWASTTNSVIERIYFGDADRDNLIGYAEPFSGQNRQLFQLIRKPVQAILDVRVGGDSLPLDDYCYDLENAWVSLADNPGSETVVIQYLYSFDQDMVVSNWDSSDGNYRFLNIGDYFKGLLILAAQGPGFANQPEIRGFSPNNTDLPVISFLAYGVNKFGANVAAGRVVEADRMEIITGPGPGDIFGPQVRTFDRDGNPVSGGSFLAYGTKKRGVVVSAGDLDGDGVDEYLTGPGPSAVFGPHVRAFSLSGGTVTPVPGAGFFAYGTRKWGVNVSSGDLDHDGMAEIITGAGPGAVFGPHVRGFNVDGGTAEPMRDVSFSAYATRQYGVNVACGDVDQDGMDEILTAPGPASAFGAHVRGWDYDGGPLHAIQGLNFFAFSSDEVRYGAKVAVLTE